MCVVGRKALVGLGEVVVCATPQGVRSITIPSATPHIPLPDPTPIADAAALAKAESHLTLALQELDEYAKGLRRAFSVALELPSATSFRGEVLRKLATGVPFGTTTTYKALAEAVGRPGAARAVGGAMRSNPIPLVVPCHRVLPAGAGVGGGYIGGYAGSAAVGTDFKKRLLALEKGVFDSDTAAPDMS